MRCELCGAATHREYCGRCDDHPNRQSAADLYLKIIEAVSRHYGIKSSDLWGQSRVKSIAEAKSMMAYLLRTMTPWSFPEIGRRMQRDHTTIMSACKRVSTHPRLLNVALRIQGSVSGTEVQDLSFGFGDRQPWWQDGARATIEAALGVVSSHYGVSREDVLGPGRTPTVLNARAIAVHLIRKGTAWSTNELGAHFHRDHTSILNSLHLVDTHPGLKKTAAQLEARMQALP